MATIDPHLAANVRPRTRVRSQARETRLPPGSGILLALALSAIFWLGLLVLVL